MVVFVAVLLLLAYPALGQVVFDESDARRGSSPTVVHRPLDNSDPEMKRLAEQYFGRGPCNSGPGVRCPEAGLPLEAGGDRMAAYLIRQYEESFHGGNNTQTLLSGVARTRSDTGVAYVLDRTRSPRDKRELDEALYAIARVGDGRSADAALAVLRTTDDPQIEAVALMALGENLVRMKAADRPQAALEALRRYARGDAKPLSGMRVSQARHYLKEMGESF